MNTIDQKCETILKHGLLLELFDYHLLKLENGDKLSMIFELFCVGEKAADDVANILNKKEVASEDIESFEKECVDLFWNILDVLEERYKKIFDEIAALKFLLLKNSVFSRNMDENYFQKALKKYTDILGNLE